MKNSKYILFILIFFSCEDIENPRYELEVNPRLEQDQNNFYHLKLKRENTQTLHRLNLSMVSPSTWLVKIMAHVKYLHSGN